MSIINDEESPCHASVEFEPPRVRPLKAYAFDPSEGQLLGNEMSVEVRYQELDPGPVVRDASAGNAIAVIDYNSEARVWYRPVNLDDPRVLIRGGLAPSESDPRFHQQMVYAVATETIQHFEAALGRQIHWRRAERGPDAPNGWHEEDIRTLCLYPHAMMAANAFYSPKAHGILFGYFRADADEPGHNLPGQLVYTCLSHDIIAHEMTHAIIDGIRSQFTLATNPDVVAFHEAFADLTALFLHFTHGEVLLDTIERTGGMMHRNQLRPDAVTSADDFFQDSVAPVKPGQGRAEAPWLTAQVPRCNPLVELAQQFGEARGMKRGLRSALGTPPRPEDLHTVFEPHLRGSILVAAVFDAFFSTYLRRTADLFRIYRDGGGSAATPDVPRALACRLAEEASRTAGMFFTICVRALDYCPPVDITFGDFLRAMVTADLDLHPADALDVRDALMQSFRRRGIIPERSCSFSAGAIAWPRAAGRGLPPVKGLGFGDPNGLTADEKRANGLALRNYISDPDICEKLGLDPSLHVEIPSFHPVFRVDPDGSLRTDMVVELVQRREALFHPSVPGLGAFPLLGGVTLIISKPMAGKQDSDRDARIRYVIGKRIHDTDGARREQRQRDYWLGLGLAEGSDPNRFRMDLSMVHGGL